MYNAFIEEINGERIINIGDKSIPEKEFYKEFGMNKYEVNKKFKSLDEEQLIEWIEEKHWIRENGIAATAKVYKSGEGWLCVEMVVRSAKVSPVIARRICKQFRAGKINLAQALAGELPEAETKSEWGGLTSKERPNPEYVPGKWELENLNPRFIGEGKSGILEMGKEHYFGPVY